MVPNGDFLSGNSSKKFFIAEFGYIYAEDKMCWLQRLDVSDDFGDDFLSQNSIEIPSLISNKCYNLRVTNIRVTQSLSLRKRTKQGLRTGKA